MFRMVMVVIALHSGRLSTCESPPLSATEPCESTDDALKVVVTREACAAAMSLKMLTVFLFHLLVFWEALGKMC